MHLTFNLTSLIFIPGKNLLFPFSTILCLIFLRLGTIFFTFISHETLPSMQHIKSYLFYESFLIAPAESNLFHFQVSCNTCGCIVNLSLTIYCLLWQVRFFLWPKRLMTWAYWINHHARHIATTRIQYTRFTVQGLFSTKRAGTHSPITFSNGYVYLGSTLTFLNGKTVS